MTDGGHQSSESANFALCFGAAETLVEEHANLILDGGDDVGPAEIAVFGVDYFGPLP
jgi:hypothetical protein